MLTPADRRPITLLNCDYKILTRILAWRLRPLLALHLKATQYCGVPGNTIFDAVATVRDVIAYAEHEKLPMCVLTLDFQHAFDRLPHEYLYTILRSYGLSTHFVNCSRHYIRRLRQRCRSTATYKAHSQFTVASDRGVR